MPELPEVEIVKRGLEEILVKPAADIQILKIQSSQKKLRNTIDAKSLRHVRGQTIRSLERKAKYIIIELEDHCLISHLGMTGSWRREMEPQLHDHVRIFLSNKQILTYNDPRRFGIFDVIKKSQINNYRRFVELGPDPVLTPEFNGDYLLKVAEGRAVPIKSLIMNQQIVVGVGNIYASEALFLSGIHPLTPSTQLTRKQMNLLAAAIKEVLLDAIVCGGTTISDFKHTSGSSGGFQNFLLVYGKSLENCLFCQTVIQSQVIVGRNSFWCPECQTLM